MNDAAHGQPEAGGQAGTDAFSTISAPAETEIKILGSRFLSYAAPVRSAAEFAGLLEKLRARHHSATHHCYAYRLGMDRENFRYSDDGEPSGTAGKRILGAIDRHGLSDVGIVVVRYFGGTKLGVGGLGRAYADSAEAVLRMATVIERILTAEFTVNFPFDLTSKVHHLLESAEAEVLARRYAETVTYTCRVRASRFETCREGIVEGTNHVATVTSLPG